MVTEQQNAEIRNFILSLPEQAKGHEDKLRGKEGTAKLVLGPAGTYRATLRDGRVEVMEGDGSADVTARMKPEDFVKAIHGRLNWMLALATGRIKLDGNISLLMKLREAFS